MMPLEVLVIALGLQKHSGVQQIVCDNVDTCRLQLSAQVLEQAFYDLESDSLLTLCLDTIRTHGRLA